MAWASLLRYDTQSKKPTPDYFAQSLSLNEHLTK